MSKTYEIKITDPQVLKNWIADCDKEIAKWIGRERDDGYSGVVSNYRKALVARLNEIS